MNAKELGDRVAHALSDNNTHLSLSSREEEGVIHAKVNGHRAKGRNALEALNAALRLAPESPTSPSKRTRRRAPHEKGERQRG